MYPGASYRIKLFSYLGLKGKRSFGSWNLESVVVWRESWKVQNQPTAIWTGKSWLVRRCCCFESCGFWFGGFGLPASSFAHGIPGLIRIPGYNWELRVPLSAESVWMISAAFFFFQPCWTESAFYPAETGIRILAHFVSTANLGILLCDPSSKSLKNEPLKLFFSHSLFIQDEMLPGPWQQFTCL